MLTRHLNCTALAVALVASAPGAAVAQCARDSVVQLATPTGTLAGSLLLPERTTPMPVAFLIAGSGPTDRDGNSPLLAGHNNSLRLLAESLCGAGIATLRVDKRGVGASVANVRKEEDLRFDGDIADAVLWVARLRASPRFSTITVIGHSEGSLIGMVVARTAKVDGYVSIAGSARDAATLLRDQLRSQLPAALFVATDSVLRDLEGGRTDSVLPRSVAGIPALASLFRPSVQPYLISWIRYHPTEEIARLDIPVLIVQGSTDIQVSVVDARALAAAKPGAQLEIVDGMNHVFKTVPADRAKQIASYSDSTLAVTPALPVVIAAFVPKVRLRKPI